MIKKKDTTTKTGAKFWRGHETRVNINGYEPSDDSFKSYEDELKKKEKLRQYLRRAKAAGDTELVKEIEVELGIKSEEPNLDKDKDKKIDEAISQYYTLLQNPELDDKLFNRYQMIIQSLNMQRSSNSKSTNQFMPPPMAFQPRPSNQPDQMQTLQTMMFDFMKSLIENKKSEQLSPMEQFEKFETMINQRMPSLKDQLQEAQELMKLTGSYVDGNTSLEQLKLKAEMDRTDKEFLYKAKELELKKEQNRGIFDLGNELASALISGAVESLTDDDEEEEDAKEIETHTKTQDKINLHEKNPGNDEYYIDCKRCEVSFKIDHLDKPREVACVKCGWPHYFFKKDTGKFGYVGPDPNGDMMNGEPDKWLEEYKPGTLEKEAKAQLENMKKEQDDPNE